MFNTKEEIFYSVILVSIFFLILVGIIIVTGFLYYKRKKTHLLEVSEFQNTLLRTKLEIQEQTFKTISQEIHDNIGQMLSLAKLNLNRMDTDSLKNLAEKEKLKDSKELVSKAIQDLRDLSKTLNTESITSVGLLRAIEMELQLLQKAGSMQTKLETEGVYPRLDSQKELILFRIYQEALHNIIKHAAASFVNVTAISKEQSFELIITDDGCGFDNRMEDGFGSGLNNMQNRSRLIGATWNIFSSPGEGTRIQINLPLNN